MNRKLLETKATELIKYGRILTRKERRERKEKHKRASLPKRNSQRLGGKHF